MKLKVSRFDNIGLDFCFDLPSNFGGKMVVPKLKFHFKRVDLELPTENYMVGDSGTGVLCLAMAALGSILIFGNVQQQNLLIIHDLERERIKIRESHGHGVYLSPANFAYMGLFLRDIRSGRQIVLSPFAGLESHPIANRQQKRERGRERVKKTIASVDDACGQRLGSIPYGSATWFIYVGILCFFVLFTGIMPGLTCGVVPYLVSFGLMKE
ncbi:hypothetical protein LguiB_032853 [Lonicera macranthoides]